VATVKALAAAGLLQGMLCTPNALSEAEEYRAVSALEVRAPRAGVG
jgi:hypothetical protein